MNFKCTLVLCFSLTLSAIGHAEGLNILAFGDSGTGTRTQMQVAESMKRVCDRDGCDVGIMLGDNFYEDGVRGVSDSQFEAKYERPYGKRLGIPFYVSLGNHDDRGDTEAQVRYTRRSKSKTWNMPATYYDKVIGDVHLIALDTNTLRNKYSSSGKAQRRWLENTLKNSESKWKIVFGHHPIYSYGRHGATSNLVKTILPLMCNYGSVYVSGHDHDLQMINTQCGTPLVVSGAAAKLRSVKRPKGNDFTRSTYGYVRLEMADSMKVVFYDAKDRVIHTAEYFQKDESQDPSEPENPRDNTPEPKSTYVELAKKKAFCGAGYIVSGFSYDGTGDDQIKGAYCKKHENVATDARYVRVENLSGSEYTVNCASDEAIIGIRMGNSLLDDHLKGMYCAKIEETGNSEYVDITEPHEAFMQVMCDGPMRGVHYDDSYDKHILGVHCHTQD
jgi:tartrate-resistant acid phosphatase type 5